MKVVLKIISLVLAASLIACGSSADTAMVINQKEIIDINDGEITGTITVSCYDTMIYEKFLNETAALFEHEYPDTKINIEAFAAMPDIKKQELDDGSVVAFSNSGDDSQEQAQYIMKINTELMSGKGPDILAFDILPYYMYAESGTLEDLSLFMESDIYFDINEYLSNIIENTKYKGRQYIVPLDFAFQFITFDKNRIEDATAIKLREKNIFTYWEISDLIDEQFANDSSDARVINFQNGANQAFSTLFRDNYNKYVDLENKKANFTDGSFEKLLNDIKNQRDKGWFRPDLLSAEDIAKDFIESQRLYYYKYQIDMVLKNIFTPQDASASSVYFPIPDADEIAGLLVNDTGKISFRCFQLYGINYNSQNKKLAWEFIKLMLSKNMQRSLNLLGMPVNNTAFIEDSKMHILQTPNWKPAVEDDLKGEYTIDGFQTLVGEEYATAYGKYMEYLDAFVKGLSYYPVTDKIISNMVTSETELFFDGTRSAQETADTLQNKVQLYLDE